MSVTRWLVALPIVVTVASTSPALAEFHLKGVDIGSACHEVTATEVAGAGAGAVGTLLLFVYTPSEDVELKIGAGYVFAQSALDLYKTGKYAFAKCPQPPAGIKNVPVSAQSGTPSQGVVVMLPKPISRR
jgi:hypothetical protein